MTKKPKIEDYQTPYQPTWCSGCGNYGIWVSLKKALIKLGISPSDVLTFYGIGCHGHMVNYLKSYGFEGLHGRATPVAVGTKLANHKLNVVVMAGDGDQLSEGGNHFIHACRNNYNITCLLHDNQIYGLTVGQNSPTSYKGSKSRSSPYGVIEEPLSPLSLAIISGATFVARSFSGDPEHLTETITQAIQHRGFSFVDIFQPCVVFNHLNTYSWFYKRVYKLDKKHNPQHKEAALKKSMEGPGKLPLGVFYQVNKPTFEDQLPQLKDKPLIDQPVTGVKIDKLLKEFS